MQSSPIIIYGSYGYTGQLIVEECKAKGIDVILSGRNAEQLRNQSEQTGYNGDTWKYSQRPVKKVLKKFSRERLFYS